MDDAFHAEIEAEITKRERIGKFESFDTLKEELQGNPNFIKKIPELETRYKGLRRVRGDGNCFFRGFMFRYLENLLTESAETLNSVVTRLRGSLGYLVEVGYSETSIELFCDIAVETIEGLHANPDIEKLFSESGNADYLVWFSRLVCSGFIKHNRERFLPFIDMSIDDFCAKEIEPMGRECEQVQIIALCEYLQVNVRIEYLDSSDNETTSSHIFGLEENLNIHLLYRPSHYDILYLKTP